MTNPLLTPFHCRLFCDQAGTRRPCGDQSAGRLSGRGRKRGRTRRAIQLGTLCQPLAEVDDVLGRIFSPVSHLNSVKNSPELREAYEQTRRCCRNTAPG